MGYSMFGVDMARTTTVTVICESAGEGETCDNKEYCIALSEEIITAESGLCVVIPCSFTTAADDFTVKNIIWYKCDGDKANCDLNKIFDTSETNKKQTGRVSLLEPDPSKKNCSIVINDLTKSDSGSYQLTVNGALGGKESECTFSRKTTVSVTDLSQKPTVIVPLLTEGQKATLTCTAPGLCSGSVPTITWMWRGRGEKATEITGNLTERKTENLTAVTQRHSSTLTFNASAEHQGTQVTCKVGFTGDTATEETVTLNVTYIKITGNTTVKEGDALNLTCSGYSSSDITWTEPGSKKKHEATKTDLQNNTGTSTLFISNMRSDHAGRYICTAKHLNTTLTTYADVTVTWYRNISNNSGCEKFSQSNVMTCVCISQGVPLPTIKWPLLESHTGYSVITIALNHTVNSTITLPGTDHRNTVVECVSSYGNGEEKVNLNITETNRQEVSPVQHYIPACAVLPWVLGVSLSLNVFSIIYVVFLWSTRRKVKPLQEDRTYMSLKKRDQSAEYDVIGHPQR
ncbi:sialic acid-binding Ig-like lectin 5 [Scomber japonicus]|uniref:sialic acid-binding Ig-like lectin 5 n=1 Tax=Scomber japonicus TaxID=13676 RepID=UPI002306CB9E|nr:sialic acid-binding Ig-like lectin 5 [Scomber japonicus]